MFLFTNFTTYMSNFTSEEYFEFRTFTIQPVDKKRRKTQTRFSNIKMTRSKAKSTIQNFIQ